MRFSSKLLVATFLFFAIVAAIEMNGDVETENMFLVKKHAAPIRTGTSRSCQACYDYCQTVYDSFIYCTSDNLCLCQNFGEKVCSTSYGVTWETC